MSEFIDSRDLIKRLEEIEEELEGCDEDERADLEEEAEEIREMENCAEDWIYGATFIRDDYFVSYAQNLAEDIGANDRDAAWPLSFIDWDAAADALKIDYTEVEYRGHTYWVR